MACELCRLRDALEQIRQAGNNDSTMAQLLQMYAAWALYPETFPKPDLNASDIDRECMKMKCELVKRTRDGIIIPKEDE